jgi:hypothetical protein
MAFSEDDAMNFVNNDVNFIAEIYILYPEAIGHSVNAAWLEDCNQITSVKSLH